MTVYLVILICSAIGSFIGVTLYGLRKARRPHDRMTRPAHRTATHDDEGTGR